MMIRVLAVLAVISVACVSANLQGLCSGAKKCPIYKLIKKYNGYEEREYEPSVWIETTQSAGESKLEVFTRLFRYTTGANARSETVPKHLPVVGHLSMVAGVAQHENMRFFLGQDSPTFNPPNPADAAVHIHRDPKQKYYVLGFRTTDWRNMELWKAKARHLKAITGSTLNEFCAASYGPREGEKYNEVWIHTSSDHADHHHHHHTHTHGHQHHDHAHE